MILAGAFEGFRLRVKEAMVLAGLVAVSIAAGLSNFATGAADLRWGADMSRAAVTALDLAGDRADPQAEISLVPYFDLDLNQERFREIKSRYGMPTYSAEEIQDADEEVASSLDSNLIVLLGMDLKPALPAVEGGCRQVGPGEADPAATLRRGAVTFRTGRSPLAVRAGRFAEGTRALGQVPPGEVRTLTIPGTDSAVAWRIVTVSAGRARVCVTR